MDVFVFPGQGAQKLGMGKALFDEVKEFQALEAEADDILGYSVRQLCLEDPERRLNNTEFTQPALYVVNALHHYAALASGRRPKLLAGHSLGEINALLAAGAIDFLTGLRLVKRRGELMGQARNGGMAAVIGLTPARIEEVITGQLPSLDVANFNSPAQVVISGPLDDIKRAAPLFEQAGAQSYITLPVSAAFHSRYMQDAANEFGEFLAQFEFGDIDIPVIANVTARPYRKGDPASIPALLVRQIASPVQWTHSVTYLLGRGATNFHEVGPGNILTRLIQQIRTPAAADGGTPRAQAA